MPPQLKPSDIERMKEKNDLDGLTAALKDADSKVRWAAATALCHLADPDMIQALVAALQDADQFVRRAVAEGLGKMGDRRVWDPLVNTLGDKDPFVRRAAIESLEQIGGVTDWTPFDKALKDDFGDVRAAAVRIYAREAQGYGLDKIMPCLGDVDQVVRKTVVKTLAGIGEPAVEPLIRTLQHDSWVVRQFAAWAMADMRDKRFVDPLIEALRDREAVVREVAARALGAIGDPRARQALDDIASGDVDRAVRRSAMDAKRKL